jgi:hypothetical protein
LNIIEKKEQACQKENECHFGKSGIHELSFHVWLLEFLMTGPTARRMRRQADGWRREAEARSDDANDGSIRLVRPRSPETGANRRMGAKVKYLNNWVSI